MILCAVFLAGTCAALTMPLGRLPDIAVPRVVVEAGVPGLPAATVRALVASPLEDALASAKGLLKSSSMSRDGRAVLVLDFRWGVDPSRAAGRVREIIDAAYQSLPTGADKPNVLPYDPQAEPLVVASLSPRNGDMAFARRLAEYEARSRLRRIEGAGAVVLVGGIEREVAVAVDMRKAAVRGLTVAEVARVIAAENADMPSGSLREGNLELVAVASGRAPDVAALADLVATGPSGSFRLSDIAIVEERDAPRASVFVADGEERVALELYQRPGADPVATARKARAVIDDMAREFERDADIRLVRDASIPIARSIRDLALAALMGAAIAAAALFLLLRDFKAGILVAVSIPVSVAATLGVLAALGRSLNGMSLGGIGLAIGMISDNAVVILDALSSRFSASVKRPSPEEIADATGNALAGTFGSMTTTVVVFVPVFFLPGAIGGLFGDLAVSIIVANIAGWLAAVLALPAAYRVFWSRRTRLAGSALERAYRRMLAFGLRRPVAVIALAAAAAAGGAALVASRPVSFMPMEPATELTLIAMFPAGTDPDGMARAAGALSAVLASVPGITGAYGGAGAEDDDLARRADPGYARETLAIRCTLAAKADVEALRSDLAEAARATLPGDVEVSVRVPPDPAATLLGLDGGSMIAARGDTVEEARLKADEVSARIELEAGDALASIHRTPSGTKPRVILRPNREAQARVGVSLADTAAMVRAATEGVDVAVLETEGREIAIRVFAEGAGIADGGGSIREASAVPVSASSGAPVTASAVARFERTYDEAAVARLDRSDVVYLEPISVTGRERELSEALERALEGSSGVGRADESAFRLYGTAMAGAVALVLILLYLTLGAQFESFTLPVAIMATIPLAMAGAGPALAISGIGLDSGSVLGLIVLFGVVVNNAILLYETSAARRAAGISPAVAAYAGASERVRPVLATTLTTVMALLPICLSPSGAAQKSMSVAMLGGLVASTSLTLFVSPVLFARPARTPSDARDDAARRDAVS